MSNCVDCKEHYGRVDREFKLEQFTRDLAAALGYAAIISDPGTKYPTCWIDAGEDMRLHVRSNYGAKISKADIGAGTAGNKSAALEYHNRLKFPSISVDSGRDMAAIAKDVKRRLIDPSRALVEQETERCAKHESEIAAMLALAENLKKDFPGLELHHENKNAKTMELYLNNGAGYLYGEMSHDGRCAFQQFSVKGLDGARRIFAAMTGETK
ncbi:MAG: hypothetical protein WC829_02060 [Hyphomicrobium sp.]|jgi:hypothetical protein